MPSYLERYLSGEYEQVWDEMMALGAAVRDEPLYADARAVARETMRRVRHNIEALIPRLEELGYTFGYKCASGRYFADGPHLPRFTPPSANVAGTIADLERRAGVLPLSLRAFYEVVGSVNFVGEAPMHWHYDETADPLFVYPIEDALAEYADWYDAKEALANDSEFDPGPYRVPIAPDYLHKYDISGGMWYNIVLPNSDADARLEAEGHSTSFVNYLRICFRWAGFPGFDSAPNPPLEDIVFLTKELLPI